MKGCLGPRYRPPYQGGDSCLKGPKQKIRRGGFFVLMSGEGFEPSSLSALDPKSSVAANFTTPTLNLLIHKHVKSINSPAFYQSQIEFFRFSYRKTD